nr:hypothetical protein Iba_scaffold47108CG0010 [Ipomoea batatas]GMD77253.1 hypothetical protein Iba_chr13cCG1560 [Ipomoea batatas]GMD80337.1 hypothetical protein Iba_chr13eCG0880 [Ipomoea batatas]GMD81655.1 hypothetical protein Iba_chr13fCG0490 [Ipomoea batatas]GME15898.1 hypothetical protein Iba_scaffold16883CG0090 [Ipomoea batatas]
MKQGKHFPVCPYLVTYVSAYPVIFKTLKKFIENCSAHFNFLTQIAASASPLLHKQLLAHGRKNPTTSTSSATKNNSS